MKLPDVPYPTRLCVELLHYATTFSNKTQDMRVSEIKDHISIFFSDGAIDEAVAILTGTTPK